MRREEIHSVKNKLSGTSRQLTKGSGWMRKKKAPASSKSMNDHKSPNESVTKADVPVVPASLDVMQRELEELSKRAAPDTESD